jgi:prepilin-type processing-associated H-X9-DG protein
MIDPLHHQLLGHLLGALDDDEQQYVDARLEQDEEFCRALAQWRQRLAPLEALRPDFEPPPGLADRVCRYVAAQRPVAICTQSSTARPCMSNRPTPPSHVGRFGWLDMATAALLLIVAVAIILPAIDDSRFHARLATCQDGLHQFGQALSHYVYEQDEKLSQFAKNGRLTPAGVSAALSLRNNCVIDSHRDICPSVWLAAQNIAEVSTLGAIHLDPNPLQPTGNMLSRAYSYYHRPGMWRNGMTDGWRTLPVPANTPLLADAPSADLPGYEFTSHGGRGRNFLFEDGHAEFVPSISSQEISHSFSSHVDGSRSQKTFAPIVLVSGR